MQMPVAAPWSRGNDRNDREERTDREHASHAPLPSTRTK
jgi:hypothetical protein